MKFGDTRQLRKWNLKQAIGCLFEIYSNSPNLFNMIEHAYITNLKNNSEWIMKSNFSNKNMNTFSR